MGSVGFKQKVHLRSCKQNPCGSKRLGPFDLVASVACLFYILGVFEGMKKLQLFVFLGGEVVYRKEHGRETEEPRRFWSQMKRM